MTFEPISDIQEWPHESILWHLGYYRREAAYDPIWQYRVDEMQAEIDRRTSPETPYRNPQGWTAEQNETADQFMQDSFTS
jgi:hypothetical protein